jgi:hypothetical protein
VKRRNSHGIHGRTRKDEKAKNSLNVKPKELQVDLRCAEFNLRRLTVFQSTIFSAFFASLR